MYSPAMQNAIREQCRRICHSVEIGNSKNNPAYLEEMVEAALEGVVLDEAALFKRVEGRAGVGLARVVAGTLRHQALPNYYSGSGLNDPIVILLPRDDTRRNRFTPTIVGDLLSPALSNLFLNAKSFCENRTPENLHRALGELRLLLAERQFYAPAHALYGECCAHLALHGDDPKEVLGRALKHLNKALEINPYYWPAFRTLAAVEVFRWNHKRAEKAWTKAVMLSNENVTNDPWYIPYFFPPREAVTMVDDLLARTPGSRVITRLTLNIALALGNEFTRALQNAHGLQATLPGQFLPHFHEGMIHLSQEAYAEAVIDLEKSEELAPNHVYSHGFTAWAYGKLGRCNDAAQCLRRLEERRAKGYVVTTLFTVAYIGLNRLEDALLAFKESIRVGDPLAVILAKWPAAHRELGHLREFKMLAASAMTSQKTITEVGRKVSQKHLTISI